MHGVAAILIVLLLVLADFTVGGLVVWGGLELVNYISDTGIDFGFLHGLAGYVILRIIKWFAT